MKQYFENKELYQKLMVCPREYRIEKGIDYLEYIAKFTATQLLAWSSINNCAVYNKALSQMPLKPSIGHYTQIVLTIVTHYKKNNLDMSFGNLGFELLKILITSFDRYRFKTYNKEIDCNSYEELVVHFIPALRNKRYHRTSHYIPEVESSVVYAIELLNQKFSSIFKQIEFDDGFGMLFNQEPVPTSILCKIITLSAAPVLAFYNEGTKTKSYFLNYTDGQDVYFDTNEIYGFVFPDELYTNQRYIIQFNNESHVERNDQLDICTKFIIQHKNESSLLYIQGPAGVGKSSFLSFMLQRIQSAEQYNCILYFMEENKIDYNREIERLYNLIYKKIKDLAELYSKTNIKIQLEEITENDFIEDRFAQLFHIYSNSIYKNTSYPPLLIIIDSIDFIKNQTLISYFLQPTHGIHFMVSGRQNTLEELLYAAKFKYPFFHVFKSDNGYSLSLENFTLSMTQEFCEKKLGDIFSNMTEDARTFLYKKIFQKSKGLPMYLKFIMESIKKIDKKDHDSLEKFVDLMPDDLKKYYNNIFMNLGTSELTLLKVLYWLEDPISKNDLLDIVGELESLPEDKAFDNIKYLLSETEGYFSLYHFSVREALFDFFAMKDNMLTGLKFSEEFVRTKLEFINKSLGALCYKNNLISPYVQIEWLHQENMLYRSLKSLSEYLLKQKNVSNYALNLYYLYVRTTFLSTIFDTQKIRDASSDFTQLFGGPGLSDDLKNFAMRVFLLFSSIKINGSHTHKLLIRIGLMSENYYFVAKYFYGFHYTRYNELIELLTDPQTFALHNYHSLDSLVTKSYVSKMSALNGWNHSESCKLYSDNDLAIIYKIDDNCKKNSDFEKLYDEIEHTVSQQRKQKKSKPEQLKRQYDFLKYSRNSKLKQGFIKRIKTLIYLKRRHQPSLNENLSTKNINPSKQYDDLINRIQFDIILENIDSFNKISPVYLTLPTEYKHLIDHIFQLREEYKAKGLTDAFFSSEHSDFFEFYPFFISEKDVSQCLKQFKLKVGDPKLMRSIIENFIKCHDDDFSLNIIRDFIHENPDFGSLYKFQNLINIFYKLKDFQALKNLQQNLVVSEIEKRVHTRIIVNAAKNSIENFTDLLNILKPNVAKDALIYRINENISKVEDLIGFINQYMISKPEYVKHVLLIYFNHYDTLANFQDIYKRFHTLLDEEEAQEIRLKLLSIVDPQRYLNVVKTFTQKRRMIHFLELFHANRHHYTDFEFWQFILQILISGTEDVQDLFDSIKGRRDFENCLYSNPVYFHQLLEYFNREDNGEHQEIKTYFNSRAILFKDQMHFIEAIKELMIPEEMLQNKILFSMIERTTDKNLALELSTYLETEFGKSKAHFMIGLMYQDSSLLQNSFHKLMQLKKTGKIQLAFFDNLFMYTTPKILGEKNNKKFLEMLKSITITNYMPMLDSTIERKNIHKLYNYLSFESDIAKFEDNIAKFEDNIANSSSFTNELNLYLLNGDKFLKNYILYFAEQDISMDVSSIIIMLEEDIESFLEKMVALYDQYKSAESSGNQLRMEQLEATFNLLKHMIKQNPEHLNQFESRFGNLDWIELDTLFDDYIWHNNSKINTHLLATSYLDFYLYIKNLNDKLYDAKQENDKTLYNEVLNEFNEIKETIRKDENLSKILIKESNIDTIDQFKLSNFHLLKPKQQI